MKVLVTGATGFVGGIAEETGLEVVILRPPLVYGPGVKANFLSLFKKVGSFSFGVGNLVE